MTERDNQLMILGMVLRDPAMLPKLDIDHFDLEFQTVLRALESRAAKETPEKSYAGKVWFETHHIRWGTVLKDDLMDWLAAYAGKRKAKLEAIRSRQKATNEIKALSAGGDPRKRAEPKDEGGNPV